MTDRALRGVRGNRWTAHRTLFIDRWLPPAVNRRWYRPATGGRHNRPGRHELRAGGWLHLKHPGRASSRCEGPGAPDKVPAGPERTGCALHGGDPMITYRGVALITV